MRIPQKILQKRVYISYLASFCIQKEDAIFSGLEKPPVTNLRSLKGFLYLLLFAKIVLRPLLFAGQIGRLNCLGIQICQRRCFILYQLGAGFRSHHSPGMKPCSFRKDGLEIRIGSAQIYWNYRFDELL
jgi:hypothetical protein